MKKFLLISLLVVPSGLFFLNQSNLIIGTKQSPKCMELEDVKTLPQLDILGFCMYPDLESPEHQAKRDKLEIQLMCQLTDSGLNTAKETVKTDVDQANRDNCLKIRDRKLKNL